MQATTAASTACCVESIASPPCSASLREILAHYGRCAETSFSGNNLPHSLLHAASSPPQLGNVMTYNAKLHHQLTVLDDFLSAVRRAVVSLQSPHYVQAPTEGGAAASVSVAPAPSLSYFPHPYSSIKGRAALSAAGVVLDTVEELCHAAAVSFMKGKY
jgi:hypothetical protein